MNGENISIRRATEQDHPAIRGLVRGERLNPTDLKWPNFLVAAADGHIVGAIQMRKHADGSRELGSLVVSKESRGQGVATRLIDALLATESGPVWMLTANAFAGAYSRWAQPSYGKSCEYRLILQAPTNPTTCDPRASSVDEVRRVATCLRSRLSCPRA